ncbi:unnamed protein product, partial [Polarella glacialis]
MAPSNGSGGDAANGPAVSFTLRFGSNGGPPQQFTLRPGAKKEQVIRIGRNPKGDIISDLSGVSFHHAELKLMGGRLCIVDLSSNATGLKVPGGAIARVKRGEDTEVIDGSVVVLPLKVKAEDGKTMEDLRMCFVVEYDTSAAGEAKSALSEAEEAEEAEKESTPPAPSKGSAEHQDEMLDAFLAARKDEDGKPKEKEEEEEKEPKEEAKARGSSSKRKDSRPASRERKKRSPSRRDRSRGRRGGGGGGGRSRSRSRNKRRSPSQRGGGRGGRGGGGRSRDRRSPPPRGGGGRRSPPGRGGGG